jgi:hypothetical protein
MAWIMGVAGLAGAMYSGIQANNTANTQGQLTEQQLQQQFQDQMYMAQYNRANTLQDRNAKIKAIDRFNGATPANASTFVPGSQPVAAGSEQLFSTANLNQFDPSIVGDGSSQNPNSLIGYMTAHPNG